MKKPLALVLFLTCLAAATRLQGPGWSVEFSAKSAKARSATAHVTLYEQPAKCDNGNQSVLSGTVVALLPPFTSVYTNTEDWCSMSFTPIIGFKTINLRQPDHDLSLLDFYSESQVLAAFLRDPYIRKGLGKKQPRSLEDLFSEVTLPCASLEEQNLSNFAFYDVKGDQVAVRVGLPNSASETCTWGFDQLGLWLPIPKTLVKPLQQAKAQGLLMQQLNPKLNF